MVFLLIIDISSGYSCITHDYFFKYTVVPSTGHYCMSSAHFGTIMSYKSTVCTPFSHIVVERVPLKSKEPNVKRVKYVCVCVPSGEDKRLKVL